MSTPATTTSLEVESHASVLRLPTITEEFRVRFSLHPDHFKKDNALYRRSLEFLRRFPHESRRSLQTIWEEPFGPNNQDPEFTIFSETNDEVPSASSIVSHTIHSTTNEKVPGAFSIDNQPICGGHDDMLKNMTANLPEEDNFFPTKWTCSKCHFLNNDDESSCLNIVGGNPCSTRRHNVMKPWDRTFLAKYQVSQTGSSLHSIVVTLYIAGLMVHPTADHITHSSATQRLQQIMNHT
jgi:hypothetical protein